LGSALVDRLLAGGHRVDVVDDLSTGSLAALADARRTPGGVFNFHQFDVRSEDVGELIAHRRPDVIWHLAARTSVTASVERAAPDADVNIVGTLRVLDAASAVGVRKVVVASCASGVYGSPERLPIREGDRRQPRSPHGVAQQAVDSYLVTFRELHGLEFCSLVLGSVYGPSSRAGVGVVAAWAQAVAAGRPCLVHGDGAQTRDFVYVDDAVDALARAGDHADGLVLNVGTGIETSLVELHRMLVATAGAAGLEARVRSAPLVAAPARPEEVGRCCLDATRAGIYLDWHAWTPLAEGLLSVINAAAAAAQRGGPGSAGARP
jgi:UDP-glucose 4-epimerase